MSSLRTATLLLTHGVDSPPRPKMAPQLANALLRTAGERVQTTLDASIQRLARDTLTRQLSSLAASNVRDGAVLVADNATGDVLAYVGSAGPSSRSREVDGVRALRQAGSTLKPFLYELAMERGYLTAASLLKDSPVHLDTATGAYIPQDYDKDFKGLVSVRTALGSSLNIPAVRALVLVGVEPFRDRLHELGYEEIKEGGDFYGYSLALGSAEVTLWQQAQAYRALAAGGKWSPLRVRADAPAKAETSLLPADATFIVSDILSDPAARALTFGIDNHLNTPFWSAAKTGTSKDMRDNWCVGFSSRYTVAVWVGNFEGDAMHDVSGVTGAAPVWREIMSALHQNLASVAPQPPAGVVAATTKFEPAVEPRRLEWFLAERQARGAVTITRAAQIARIVTPANGMVIASDPDIPPSHQKVLIAAEGASRADAADAEWREARVRRQVGVVDAAARRASPGIAGCERPAGRPHPVHWCADAQSSIGAPIAGRVVIPVPRVRRFARHARVRACPSVSASLHSACRPASRSAPRRSTPFPSVPSISAAPGT